MKKSQATGKSPQPPRWAEQLLEWLSTEHVKEEVQCELQEPFERHLQV